MYLKLSTDNLTQLCSKHQQRNMKNREIFKIVNRQTRYQVRFWFSLYFWPKPCQYRLYLISRFPELFICESLQSWPTDQRGPSFSYISFTFTKTKFFLLVLDFYQFTQGLKNEPILPIYWCYGSPSNTIQRIFSPLRKIFLPEVAKSWCTPFAKIPDPRYLRPLGLH